MQTAQDTNGPESPTQVSPLDCGGVSWPCGVSPGLHHGGSGAGGGQYGWPQQSFDPACTACMAQLSHPGPVETMHYASYNSSWPVGFALVHHAAFVCFTHA